MPRGIGEDGIVQFRNFPGAAARLVGRFLPLDQELGNAQWHIALSFQEADRYGIRYLVKKYVLHMRPFRDSQSPTIMLKITDK